MSETQYVGFCMSCKMKKVIQNATISKMKTGMNAVKGWCADCGNKMHKILPKK